VENLKETDHPEDHGVHERIMLWWILEVGLEHGLYWCASGYGQVEGFCEYGNEHGCHETGRIFLLAQQLLTSK
jgi:hypothetical protein